MSIRELVTFYLRAVERFRLHATQLPIDEDQLSNASLARGALCEALNWADTIDQYLGYGPRNTKGTSRDPEWASKLDGADGEFVTAFRYARNHAHHQWMDLIATRIYLNDTRPAFWLWRSLSPESLRLGGSQAKAYSNQLARNPVLGSLDRLGGILWDKRGWEIPLSAIRQPGYPVGTDLCFDPERWT